MNISIQIPTLQERNILDTNCLKISPNISLFINLIVRFIFKNSSSLKQDGERQELCEECEKKDEEREKTKKTVCVRYPFEESKHLFSSSHKEEEDKRERGRR